MSNEATKTKSKFGYLEKKIFCGHGIDIGCGNDPIYPEARPFDIADGDANEITKFVHEKFDYVFSSHCLEHMRDPYKALMEWWKLVTPGGFLYLIVPEEDRYEQGTFPSRWNADHKHTFTIYKTGSWSPVSINIIDLIKILPDAEVYKIEIQDDGYDYNLHDIDQTFQGNNMDAMAQIVIVLKKHRISISKAQSLKLRFLYTAHTIITHISSAFNSYKAKFHNIRTRPNVSWALAREKFSSPKYSGLRGKIHFFSKGICIILSAIPYVATMQRNIPRVSKYLAIYSRKFYLSDPQRKQILFFLPNGLGDAIINKYFIDRILNENSISNHDAIILASDAWMDFKSILFPNITVHFFNLESFETSFAYRRKIYRLLGRYSFYFAVCNLKWKQPTIFKKIITHVNAEHKYACLHHERHTRLNTELKIWALQFDVDIFDNGQDTHETQRIAKFYTHMGLLRDKEGHRTCLQRPANANCSALAPYIVFHIGNSDKRRRWNIQKFNAVGRALTRKGYSVIFCGGKQERDLTSLIDKEFQRYIGVLSAEEYVRLISGATLLLCGDTGPAHLALALNIPTTIILGGGHYKNYFPYPDGIIPSLHNAAYITKPLDCFGCDWECRFSDERRFSCIHTITSDEVFHTIIDLLTRIEPVDPQSKPPQRHHDGVDTI